MRPLARVAYRGEPARGVYAEPGEFFASTYFTETMRRLLVDVFGVLAGQPGDRVLQLRTPFGGGKTHTLLALYHLATARGEAKLVPELAEVPDPGEVRIAVLSGEYLDPQRGRSVDGRRIATLWGELAFQLGGGRPTSERSSTATRASRREASSSESCSRARRPWSSSTRS